MAGPVCSTPRLNPHEPSNDRLLGEGVGVSDRPDGIEIERCAKVLPHVVPGWGVVAPVAERGDRRPFACRPDKDLVDVFQVNLGVLPQRQAKRTGKDVDGKVT